jgi:hypothetical protein
VVGEYDDGVPLVVVLDGEANRAKAREEEKLEARQEEQIAGDNVNGQEEAKEKEEMTNVKVIEEEWGKTVFLNFFPVSKDDPCTGACVRARVESLALCMPRASKLTPQWTCLSRTRTQADGTTGTQTSRSCFEMPFCSPRARDHDPPSLTDRLHLTIPQCPICSF